MNAPIIVNMFHCSWTQVVYWIQILAKNYQWILTKSVTITTWPPQKKKVTVTVIYNSCCSSSGMKLFTDKIWFERTVYYTPILSSDCVL